MTTTAKFTLAEQSGDAGFFGEIELRINTKRGDERLAISYPDDCPEHWKLAIGFGIAYAREHSPKLPGSQNISVDVKGYLVDTSTIVLAFVAANAFWKAVGQEAPSNFRLDKDARTFLIPK